MNLKLVVNKYVKQTYNKYNNEQKRYDTINSKYFFNNVDKSVEKNPKNTLKKKYNNFKIIVQYDRIK